MNRPERSSEEIRRDIERTRAEMDETVEELEARLTPGQILDQAWGAMRGTGAEGVVRDHPVPLALMGLGVAWLAVEKATGGDRHPVGPGTYDRAEGRVGPYGGDAVDHDDSRWAHNRGMKEKASDAADRLKDRVSDRASKAKERVTDAASTARERASEMKDRVESAGDGTGARDRVAEVAEGADRAKDRAKEEARYRTRQAKQGFRSMLDDNPLALGAVAFGLGLAGGLAAPTTRWEDRAMGETSETLKHRAKDVAKETGEQAKHVAEDAARAAREEADRQGIGDDLKESAKRVAQEAKSTARQSAEREGLDAETLKERARDVGEETRQAARDEMR